jgi:hypothetical protein
MAKQRRDHPEPELPEGVGLYITYRREEDAAGERATEYAFSSGITCKEFGVLAAKAVRLHRLMTGEEMSITEAEHHLLQKLSRECRLKARMTYDRIRRRLEDRERESAECIRRAMERESDEAMRESIAALAS